MSYYEVLGLNPMANNEDIAKAYRTLALTYHPLKHPKNYSENSLKFF